jgi:hypothetical protein
MYVLRTIDAAAVMDIAPSDAKALRRIGIKAMSAEVPTIEVNTTDLELAIQELAKLTFPLAKQLMGVFAAVR